MLTALLKWQNNDSTQDLNSRFALLFTKGVVTGGAVNPVPASLSVTITPFSAMSGEGLLVAEDGTPTPTLTIPAGQTSVVSVFTQYQVGFPVSINYSVMELSAFNNLLDQNLYTVLAVINVPPLATSILPAYISYDMRSEVDKLGRSAFRGRIVRNGLTVTGSTVSGNSTISGIPSTAGIAVGSDIIGPGVQANAHVQSIVDANDLLLDTPLTVTQGVSTSTTGNTITGVAQITNIPSTAGIVIGQTITMASMPIGSKVLSIDSGTQVTADQVSFSNQSNIAATFTALFSINPSLPYVDNRPGDFYMVNNGTGDAPELYGWDGSNWINMTSVSAVATDLAAHRANLFSNEKHLTDGEQDAALGSAGSPSITNRYVTQQDPQLPTLTEAQALVGLPATPVPSASNPYVTAAYSIAQATQISLLPPGGPISLSAPNGPYYVGLGGVGTANQYFMILDSVENRAFINAFEVSPIVTGVFTDFLLTSPLNPSTDINVDANGFYTGALYLQTSSIVDAAFNLLYGKEQTLNTASRGFALIATPGNETVASSVVQSIVNTKGRPYDGLNSTVPAREQNINLRVALDSIQAYLGSVFDANVIAQAEDYEYLSHQPVIGGYFTYNIGISPVYVFQNLGQIGVNTTAYDPVLGRVTYNSAVALGSVQPGNIWQDGALNSYEVFATNGTSTVDIRDLSTGAIPGAIISFPNGANTQFGSVTVNSNPRDVLLSEAKLNALNEAVIFDGIQEIVGQYSQPNQNRTFGVTVASGRVDPRIQLYGSWQQTVDSNTCTVIQNAGYGGLIVTGFFTSLALLIRKKPSSPPLAVSVNEVTPTIISTSYSGAAAQLTLGGSAYQALVVASGLSSSNPTTVRMDISATTAQSLEVYGVQYLYEDTNGLLESGVAFNDANIVELNAQQVISIPSSPQFKRGGVYSFAVVPNSFAFGNSFLGDTDQSQAAWGASVAGSIVTINTDTGNLRFNYQVGDIIEIFNGTTAKALRMITAINYVIPATFQLDSSPGITGSVILRHVASTNPALISTQNSAEVNTYDLVNDLAGVSALDFRAVGVADRYCVAPDGITVFSGPQLNVQSVGVSGSNVGVNITATGALKISALCTRLDLVTTNTASTATVGFQIDNSPVYNLTVPGGAARRTTIILNARYQSHEIIITDPSGILTVSKVIIHQPARPIITGLPTETADLVYTATYIPSDDGVPATITQLPTFRYMPRGSVYYPAGSYMSFSGSWLSNIDWSRSFWGPDIHTTTVGNFAEFSFFGTAFELVYIVGPDSGNFTVTVDGNPFPNGGTVISTNFANVSGSTVNANAAAFGRRIVGCSGLTMGYHTVRMTLASSRMGFEGYYTANMSATSSLQVAGYSTAGRSTGVVDARQFLALTPTTPVSQFVEKDIVPISDAAVNIGTGDLGFNTTYSKSLGYTRPMITFDPTNSQADWVAPNGSFYGQQTGLTSLTLNNNTNGTVWVNSTSLANHWTMMYSIVRGASSTTGMLFVATNGVTASAAPIGVATSGSGVTFSAAYLGGNVTLSYTTDNSGSPAAMEYFFFRWT